MLIEPEISWRSGMSVDSCFRDQWGYVVSEKLREGQSDMSRYLIQVYSGLTHAVRRIRFRYLAEIFFASSITEQVFLEAVLRVPYSRAYKCMHLYVK